MKGRVRLKARRKFLESAYFIYVLVDPRDGTRRYIGRSLTPQKRAKAHSGPRSEGKAKRAWIQELAAQGLVPSVELLASTVGAIAAFCAERDWLAFGKKEGWPLFNVRAPDSAFRVAIKLDDEWPTFMWSASDLGADVKRMWRACGVAVPSWA